MQHRDLKPQNILLVGNRAKVADLGLAREMEQGVASPTGPCTLPYAAPEYFGGKTSRQSDQYALAVSWCQLRSGQMPFLGTTAQITLGHIRDVPNLTGLPAPERPIVARALAKRPEQRWADCRALLAALRGAGAGEDCRVPEVLPREHGDPDVEEADPGGLPAFSGSTLVVPGSDFIPIDAVPAASVLAHCAARLLSTASRASRAGSRAAAVLTCGGRFVSDSVRLAAGRVAAVAGSRAAWAAAVHAHEERVKQWAALAILGLAVAAGGVWIWTVRSRADATPSDATAALAARRAPEEKPGSSTPAGFAMPGLVLPDPPIADPPDPPATSSAAENAQGGGGAPWAALLPAAESKPPDATGSVPHITLPPAVAVVAGEATRLHVRVVRADTSQPVHLEFPGLPRGITVQAPTIAAGADAAEVILSAAAGTPAGTTEVSLAFGVGAARGEVGLRLEVLPANPASIAYERGRADLARGAYAQAVGAFTEALWLGKDAFEVYLQRGFAYNLDGRLREALADYDDAIRLQPQCADAYRLRGDAFARLGDHTRAGLDHEAFERLNRVPGSPVVK